VPLAARRQIGVGLLDRRESEMLLSVLFTDIDVLYLDEAGPLTAASAATAPCSGRRSQSGIRQRSCASGNSGIAVEQKGSSLHETTTSEIPTVASDSLLHLVR